MRQRWSVPFELDQGSRYSRGRPNGEVDEYSPTRGTRKSYMVHRAMFAFCRTIYQLKLHLEHYKHTITTLPIRKSPMQTFAIALFACMTGESTTQRFK